MLPRHLAVYLDHAVHALIQVGAVTLQSRLQHPLHALRPPSQSTHLAQQVAIDGSGDVVGEVLLT